MSIKGTALLCVSVMLALGGCAPPGPESSPAATPEAASSPSPPPITTAEPSPVATTQADPEPTTAPTGKPGPSPTTEATSTPKPEDGKEVIADGFYYMKLNDKIKQRITGMSYPEDDDGIEISYDDLRYVGIRHYDFDGNVHDGELIVHRKVAKDVAEIFHELYEAKYPLASVRLVDDFGQPGDDTLSMEANNTSSFCYRRVTGSQTLSRHSYGAAVDINPMLNPYIDGDRVAPENGAQYVDRSLGLPGMIDHDDLCYKVFRRHGWTWGGDWKGDKDYQHFSKDIDF